jgi:hypothetical protein
MTPNNTRELGSLCSIITDITSPAEEASLRKNKQKIESEVSEILTGLSYKEKIKNKCGYRTTKSEYCLKATTTKVCTQEV